MSRRCIAQYRGYGGGTSATGRGPIFGRLEDTSREPIPKLPDCPCELIATAQPYDCFPSYYRPRSPNQVLSVSAPPALAPNHPAKAGLDPKDDRRLRALTDTAPARWGAAGAEAVEQASIRAFETRRYRELSSAFAQQLLFEKARTFAISVFSCAALLSGLMSSRTIRSTVDGSGDCAITIETAAKKRLETTRALRVSGRLYSPEG